MAGVSHALPTKEDLYNRLKPKQEPVKQEEPAKEPIKQEAEPVKESVKESVKQEPAKEPIKQEEPQKEPVKEPIKQEPAKEEIAFSLDSFNKAFGTELENEAALKSVLENNKLYSELNPKFEELTTKYNDLDLKSKVDPFVDDFAKGFNDLHKSGATPAQLSKYVQAQTLDLDGMSAKDKAILVYSLRDGLNDREANIAFNDEYSLNESDYTIDSEASEEEIEKQKSEIKQEIEKEGIRLKIDSKDINTFLSDYKKEVTTVEKPEDTLNKQWTEYKPQLAEITPSIVSNYAGLKLNLNGKEGEEGREFAFQVPDEFKKQIPEMLESFASSELASGNPVNLNTTEGLTRFRGHLDFVLKGVYFDKYMVDSNVHTESVIRELMANKGSNSEAKLNGDPPPQEKSEASKTRQGKYKEKMLNR